MIHAIVEYINLQLRARALEDARFANAVLHPVASPQQRGSGANMDQVPAYFINGATEYITPNDLHPVTLWHSNLGITYPPSPLTSMGGNLDFVRTFSMAMLVIANRDRIKIAAEDLELLLIEALPATMPKADLPSLKVKILNIRHQVSSFKTAELYQREFRSPKNLLKPQHVMLEVRYQIEATYTKGCLTIECFCNS
jgi:hypothetical protein